MNLAPDISPFFLMENWINERHINKINNKTEEKQRHVFHVTGLSKHRCEGLIIESVKMNNNHPEGHKIRVLQLLYVFHVCPRPT